ncbi:MAG: hypothetical protein JWO98_2657 [Frankiales bacterium]|nr:hypothetical protein [Frankiales bacterium]
MSGVGGVSSGEVLVEGGFCQTWWLVAEESDGPSRVVAGPFLDRAEAGWAAGTIEAGGVAVRPAYGIRRADGMLNRRPSPQDWEWLAHLSEQLERLPEDWARELSDEDPLTTLVVEIAAALSEAGLLLHDSAGADRAVGGACLTPEPGLGGVIVTWRQHDRMSVDQVHGVTADVLVQQVMNRAVAEVLRLRGFEVDAFGGASGHVVRLLG